MAEKNTCPEGCRNSDNSENACGCACGGKQEAVNEGRAPMGVGGMNMASQAIRQMRTEEETASRSDKTDDADCKAFLDECEKDGVDALRVVDYIARREGVVLDDRCYAPKDPAKRSVHDFLRKVVVYWVKDTIKTLDLSSAFAQVIVSYVRQKFGMDVRIVPETRCGTDDKARFDRVAPGPDAPAGRGMWFPRKPDPDPEDKWNHVVCCGYVFFL